jgi:hypothetical protein
MDARTILTQMLDKLWTDYCRRVPYAARYAQLVTEQGGTVANDHIAYRSFNCPVANQPPGYQATREIFEALGYRVGDDYDFPKMNLRAVHLEHTDEDQPRIFISQLEVDRLDPAIKKLIEENTCEPAEGAPQQADLVAQLRQADSLTDAEAGELIENLVRYFRRPWLPPLRSAVEQVNEASQYGAWTLLHGNSVNHFTAYINRQNVSAWPDIEATIEGLREAGVPMKDTIEGERGTKLRQSSTRAAEGEFPVREADGSLGEIPWTYAYYELAERGEVDTPEGRRLFTGFLGPQTPGLFEMTRKGS